MKSLFKFSVLTFLVLMFISTISPSTATAAYEYVPLAPLPGISEGDDPVDLNTYVPGMVKLMIGIAGALAILRIIFGGLKYMTSEAFGEKTDAKDTINNAIIGLLLALSAYIILYTVNPKLVNFDVSIAGLNAGGKPIGTGLGTTTPGVDTLGGNVTSTCPVPGGGTQSCTCINCVNAADDHTLMFKNGKTMNALLLKDIKTVRQNTLNIGWQITEAWPPSSPHTSACHYNGTCLDLNLTTNKYEGGTPTYYQVSAINGLARALRSAGRGVIFEVNTANFNALSAAGVDRSILRDVSTNSAYSENTAPSFHVN